MKIQFLFKWYDLWVGIFYDRKNRWIYILPFPTVGIILKLPTSPVKKLNIHSVSVELPSTEIKSPKLDEFLDRNIKAMKGN
jgi:hypothetical protein